MSNPPNFVPGDRVYVDDQALAEVRYIMRRATGAEPAPNHHGTVERVEDGLVYIVFDDGGGAPYPVEETHHLPGSARPGEASG